MSPSSHRHRRPPRARRRRPPTCCGTPAWRTDPSASGTTRSPDQAATTAAASTTLAGPTRRSHPTPLDPVRDRPRPACSEAPGGPACSAGARPEPTATSSTRARSTSLPAYTLTGDPSNGKFWDIFQFKSPLHQRSGRPDLVPRPEEPRRRLALSDVDLAASHAGGPAPRRERLQALQPLQDVTIPVGRWFTIKSRLRQSKDFDGWVQF